MAVTTFAAPLLPGKTEAWKAAVAEMTGPRREEFEESCRRMGITRDIVSLQQTPDGDFVVVCLEGDDPNGVVGRYLASDHPFDRGVIDRLPSIEATGRSRQLRQCFRHGLGDFLESFRYVHRDLRHAGLLAVGRFFRIPFYQIWGQMFQNGSQTP